MSLLVWEAGEEVRGGGRVGERDERKAFAFWEGVWGILVVWWEADVLDGVVIALQGGVDDGMQHA